MIEYYDKVLGIDPNDVDALNNKGVALKNLGNTEDIAPAITPVSQSDDSSSSDDSNDSNDSNGESSGSSGSDNDENSDDRDSEQDTSPSKEEDATEDEYEQTNPLRDQIRNRVNEALSASGIPVS